MDILDAGDGIRTDNASWTFGGDVPQNFDTHIKRSVPDYELGHELILKISDYFVSQDSVCYELGAATGSLTLKLARHHGMTGNWVGIDIEESMVIKALSQKDIPDNVSFDVANIIDYQFEKTDFVVAFYTMQFVRPKFRQELIDSIYRSLNWGGAFLMFEKVRSPDARFQDIISALYTDFKMENGYLPNEILAKTMSLKGVLEPFSTQGNMDLLSRAGFKDIMTVYKRLCFEGFFCIK